MDINDFKRKVDECLEKKKEIDKLIAIGKSTIERQQNETDQLSANIDSKNSYLESLNSLLSESLEYLKSFSIVAQEYMDSRVKAVKSADSVLDSFLKFFEHLEVKIQGLKDEEEKIRQINANEKVFLDSESARLARWESDLKIYRNRLENHIKENGLEDKIKIILN